MAEAKTALEQLLDKPGHVITGVWERHGTFTVMHGEDLLEGANQYLLEKGLKEVGSHWIKSTPPNDAGERELMIQVLQGGVFKKYRFRPDPEPHPKRFHQIGVYAYNPRAAS